jgi:hypothetical protein
MILKEQRSFSKYFKLTLLISIVIIISACGMGGATGVQPTVKVVPSATAIIVDTPTQTVTPEPTQKSTPTNVPTPAKVGAVVPYKSLEITLVGAATHDLIVPGGLYYYYPTDRKRTFLDLGVLVRNLNPDLPLRVLWKSVVIEEADGTKSSPGFADTKVVDTGKKFDPFKIGISTQVTYTDGIYFNKDTYLRLIFVVAKKQTILFSIEDSPTITFSIKN